MNNLLNKIKYQIDKVEEEIRVLEDLLQSTLDKVMLDRNEALKFLINIQLNDKRTCRTCNNEKLKKVRKNRDVYTCSVCNGEYSPKASSQFACLDTPAHICFAVAHYYMRGLSDEQILEILESKRLYPKNEISTIIRRINKDAYNPKNHLSVLEEMNVKLSLHKLKKIEDILHSIIKIKNLSKP